MLIFLVLCYASNAHLLNIYASRIYYYAQYYMLTVVAKITSQHLFLADMWYVIPMATAHSGSDSDIEPSSDLS